MNQKLFTTYHTEKGFSSSTYFHPNYHNFYSGLNHINIKGVFLLTKPKKRFLILQSQTKTLFKTIWKILILFVSPFLLQCCSHVTLQSHVNIAEGKGHAYIGVPRIFGEDCRFVIFCNQNEQSKNPKLDP